MSPGLRSVLHQRDFRLLWAAMVVSLIGDGLYFVALPFLVFVLRDTASALASVAIVFTVSQVVLLLPAGVVVDRIPRRRTLIAADLLRAAALLAIWLVGTFGGLALWHLWMLAALFGVGQAFAGPAFGAFVPQLLPAELVVAANALEWMVRPIAYRMLGPVLGGAVVAAFGPIGALAVDAVTFVVSAALIAAIGVRRLPHEPAAAASSHAWSELREGASYALRTPWLAAALAAAAVANLALGGVNQVLVPFLVDNQLHGSASDYARLLAVNGIGQVAASWYANRRGDVGESAVVVYISWVSGTALVAGYGLATQSWHLLPVALAQGVMFGPGNVWWSTLMQTRVPGRLLGRVSSFDWFVSLGLTPIGHAIAGWLAGAVGASTAIITLAAVGTAVLGVVALHPRSRRTPSLDTNTTQPPH